MRAGLENKIIQRGFGALLLTGVLLVAGASAAAADHEVPDDDGYGCEYDCYPTTTTTTPEHPPTTPPPPTGDPGPPRMYPVPPPPEAPPGDPGDPPSPPVLARTGSNTGTMVGIGAGALLLGGGLVVLARKRRLAEVPS
jgi:LPXTG-motif cell wall-anchored protein